MERSIRRVTRRNATISITDRLHTLTQRIEKKVVVNQTVHLLFVDLEKVYDSVPLNRLWETMKKINASAWG